MGPEFIVLIGVFVFAGVLKGIETFLSNKPKALPTDDFTIDSISNEPLACDALVPRVFEQRLVDAGIMEAIDMTVCDSLRCKDCKPTRDAIHAKEKCAVAECISKGTDRWNDNEMLCKPHWDMRKQAESSRRTLKSLGKRKPNAPFNWPDDVPTYANYAMDYDPQAMCNRIVFKWTDPATGRQLYKTMLVPDFSRMSDSVAIYSDQSEKPILTLPVLGREEREKRRAAGVYSHPPMTPERRAAAIRELRKNPPKPPPGKGGGSPSTGPR